MNIALLATEKKCLDPNRQAVKNGVARLEKRMCLKSKWAGSQCMAVYMSL